MVNTALDETTPDGFLSLREAVNVVNTQSTAGLSAAELTRITGTLGVNDTIEFGPSLVGKTITLTQGEIAFDIDLTIQGPGATKLAISGNNANRIFDIGGDAWLVTIAGLTLKNGLSEQGGAILDDGSPLTLRSDFLSNNQAEGAALLLTGGTGGALAVLGEATAGMTVTISNCRFANDSAIGPAGLVTTGVGGSTLVLPPEPGQGGAIYVDAQFSAGLAITVSNSRFISDSATGGAGTNGIAAAGLTAGGDGEVGQGGAVWLNADDAAQPSFSFSTDTFSKCSAKGGAGGNGVSIAGAGGDVGGNGGEGDGGALYYIAGFAASPALNVATCAFSSNSSHGGNGGAGGDAAAFAAAGSNGGNGGSGASSQGGAVFADFKDSAAGNDNFTADSFHLNKAAGGSGGNGGGNGAVGGAGGFGGEAHGGGLAIINSDVAAATQVTIAQSAITNNVARAGNGGAGGSGSVGGFGSPSFDALGGGLYLSGSQTLGLATTPTIDTWTLNGDSIAFNEAQSGNGGAGGAGVSTGGHGGESFGSFAGGVLLEFLKLQILHSTIIYNSVVDGQGGIGGSGSTPGSAGKSDLGDSGGLNISLASACQSADTVITNNQADNDPDVFGTVTIC
jgi:hypothetical protein